MAKINRLGLEQIFDFKGDYKLAKCPPKKDGYYMTVKCGLVGIYTELDKWKSGKWILPTANDSDVIAYSKEQVSKEDFEEWLNDKFEKYKNM